MARTERPTIREIANQSNKSIATVSRVLNNNPNVDERTRAQVLEVAHRINYLPGVRRSGFETGLAGTVVGLYLPERFLRQGPHFYTDEMIASCFSATQQEQCALMLLGPTHIQTRGGKLQEFAGGLKGIFLLTESERLAPQEHAILKLGIPTVVLGTVVGDLTNQYPNATYVALDNLGGAHLAVEYLARLGHRRIAFLGGPRSRLAAVERLKGFKGAMASLNLELRPEYVHEPDADDWYQISGHESLMQLWERCDDSKCPTPTAIFAANDFIAMGAVRALQEKRLPVPAKVSVIGHDAYRLVRRAKWLFNDLQPMDGHEEPPRATEPIELTSIDHRLSVYGVWGLRLLDMLSRGMKVPPLALSPELVEGKTCQEVSSE
jgi:LacI family transcriptional regulator